MNHRPARNASPDALIAYYNGRTQAELCKILPLWAVGPNKGKMQDIVLRQDRKRFIICFTDVADIIAKAKFQEVNTDLLFTGDPKNDVRVAFILHRWDHQEVVDPPT